MSELINAKNNRNDLRSHLVTTVSALALAASACGAGQAQADDNTDHHTVWIELGGQLERMTDDSERFAPPFLSGISALGFTSPVSLEHMPRWSVSGDGQISFTPDGSDWIFSAAVRYGRSQNSKHVHQAQPNLKNVLHYNHKTRIDAANEADFADTQADNREAHSVLDFQAGRDFGLGKFGTHGDSMFAVGLRFVQFRSRSNIGLGSDQKVGFGNKFDFYYSGMAQYLAFQTHYNAYTATLAASRSFQGIGPSLSWNASAVIAGTKEESEIAFDWGANAAILFGRQKAAIHHQSNAAYKSNPWFFAEPHAYAHTVSSTSFAPADQNRRRNVVVPNVGGFAGLSFRYADARVSFGYRADFFFGAMDGGIDTAKKENQSFYGPFASVSVGIGG